MTTPNMNLVELVPGVTPGPTYATNIVSNFSTIDSHDHTTGKGTRIPSAALNINANVGFGGFGPTAQGKSQFNSLESALSASGDYRSVHVVSGELYYLDGSGNSVQLTSSGSVAGSAGNITGLSSPASVTFSTNKYVFKDTANSFAIMESSDVRLFEDSASAITNYVALKSPASLASTYTLTFPGALPAGDTLVQSDSSGNLSFIDADTVAGDISSTGANDIYENVTRPVISTTGTTERDIVQANITSYSNSTSSYTAAGQVTFEAAGRPVVIVIMDSGTVSFNARVNNGGSPLNMRVLFRVTGGSSDMTAAVDPYVAAGSVDIPLNFTFIDLNPGTGSVTYTLECALSNTGSGRSFEIPTAKIMAFQL